MSKTPQLTLIHGGKVEVEAVELETGNTIEICGLTIDLDGRSPENLAAIATIGSALNLLAEDRDVVGAVVVLQSERGPNDLDEDDSFAVLTTTTNLVRLLGQLELVKQKIYRVLS